MPIAQARLGLELIALEVNIHKVFIFHG